MLPAWLVIIGAVISFVGALGYTRATLAGKTQPNRVSWLLWALAPMIAVAASLDEGVGWPVLTTFMVGFGPAMIFAASLYNRQAYWKLSRLDWLCGGLSLLALLGWLISGEGLIAICLAVLADALAGVPTVIKAWKAPQTEHSSAFRNAFFNTTLCLLTIDDWSPATWVFPSYILIFCLLMWGLIDLPRKHKTQP